MDIDVTKPVVDRVLYRVMVCASYLQPLDVEMPYCRAHRSLISFTYCCKYTRTSALDLIHRNMHAVTIRA